MKRKTIKAILIALSAVAVIAVIILLCARFEASRDVAPEGAGTAASFTTVRAEDEAGDAVSPLEDDSEAVRTIYYNGRQYMFNDNLTTLLIMGVDDYEQTESNIYRNTSQADFLLLAVFDHESKTCALLQINRDTMADIPVLGALGDHIGLMTGQIALAHTYGSGLEDSCENTADAVSRLLYDVPIDNYFSLSMGAIPILNDLVGGVTVLIEDDFTGVDDTLIQGETVTLTAENVEHFVRARMSMLDDSTNIARMRRQRVYMTALFEALSDAYKQDEAFVFEAYTAIAESLVSDCTIDEMADYAERFSDYTLSEIVTPEGEAVVGEKYMEFYVDEAALQQLVIDMFYVLAEE